MSSKVQCPECGRHFSEYLVKFPLFFDDKDETMVYNICPLCVYEKRNKSQKLKKGNPFISEHGFKLYKDAVTEIESSGEKKKKVAKKNIKWEKLTRLTPEEYGKVTKKHPELIQ